MGNPGVLQTLRLTSPQVAILEEIARRDNGEMDWCWERCRPDVAQIVTDMINKQVVVEREYTSHAGVRGRLYLRVTDRGRQVVSQVKLAKSRVAQVASS